MALCVQLSPFTQLSKKKKKKKKTQQKTRSKVDHKSWHILLNRKTSLQINFVNSWSWEDWNQIIASKSRITLLHYFKKNPLSYFESWLSIKPALKTMALIKWFKCILQHPTAHECMISSDVFKKGNVCWQSHNKSPTSLFSLFIYTSALPMGFPPWHSPAQTDDKL